LNNAWLSLNNLRNVQGSESAVCVEYIHRQLSFTGDVPFPQINHGTEVGNTIPRGVHHFSRERVQNYVDAFTICGRQDIFEEAWVAAAEYAFFGNALLEQMIHLGVVSGGAENLNR
jgi:hypothetical protein